MKEKLENLIEKYEKYINLDNRKELSEYESGEQNCLFMVIQNLKEIVKDND